MYKPIPLSDIKNSTINKKETMNVQDFREIIKPGTPGTTPAQKPCSTPDPHTMKVHIELQKKDANNNCVVVADINNQVDIYEFNRIYGHLMPRKKILGIF